MSNYFSDWRSPRILHIAQYEKFIDSHLDIIDEKFSIDNHRCIIMGKLNPKYVIKKRAITFFFKNYLSFFVLVWAILRAERVILHGLWSNYVKLIIILLPFIYPKLYWIMWGGDFYFPERQNFVTKYCIGKIQNFVTFLPGDFEYLKVNYSVKGNLFSCLMYPSNVVKLISGAKSANQKIRVLVGNSALPTNNHSEIFAKLANLGFNNYEIYCPLSYGDDRYGEKIAQLGHELFGDAFIPITDFMPEVDYYHFLSTIDVALFAHKRQQAMGNTITLLESGAKVYMRSDVSQWHLFEGLGVTLFNIQDEFRIEPLKLEVQERNREIVRDHFGLERYVKQLQTMFLVR